MITPGSVGERCRMDSRTDREEGGGGECSSQSVSCSDHGGLNRSDQYAEV